MSEIKIKCPTCGKVLRLAECPNINALLFTCPVCHDRHMVGNCQRYVQPPAFTTAEETRYGGMDHQCVGEETQVGSLQEIKVGTLVDQTGRTYQLVLGLNTIGRQAPSSTATVQIVTADRTMSRRHAVIDVRNAGGQILHIFKNDANKNPSYVNDTLVECSDQMVLNDGNRLKLGGTILTFKK